MTSPLQVRVSSYADVRDAYRHRSLRQALYDDGVALMDQVIVTLHGDAHRDRRRLENRLFRRDVFLQWEHQLIPATVEAALAPAVRSGRGDLVVLARRAMMAVATATAGVDRPTGTEEELNDLYSIMVRLSRASTIVHATGDRAAITAAGLEALAEYDARWYQPSLARRRALVASGSPLPDDVLSTLLANADALELPADVVLREVAYYPWVGAHSTSNALAHAMDHIFQSLDGQPSRRDDLLGDPARIQRFVHESLRLHPPSPEARREALDDAVLGSGTTIPKGAAVTLDVSAANRDQDVFGQDSGSFDPDRQLPDGVSRWGLAFGSGYHACLGQDLAGGTAAGSGAIALQGSIATMARILLEHGARPDPDDPPTADAESTRPHFGRYPLLFD